MPDAPPKHPHPHSGRARIAGAVLLALGGVCAYLFTEHSGGTLARFGFPRAWAGAPILLGAAFCGITGGFLLVQRRFSLAALMVAGIVAAVVAAGAQAYILSIHSIAIEEKSVLFPPIKNNGAPLLNEGDTLCPQIVF